MNEKSEFLTVPLESTGPKFLTEVLVGLSKSQKAIHPKFLYDNRGTEIFEQISKMHEYYPCRTEHLILKNHAREMARFIGSNALIIEPGCGISEKVKHLLARLSRIKGYVPIDISQTALLATVKEISRSFPRLNITPVCGDFTENLELPLTVNSQSGKKVIFFPGSTIGNLQPDQAINFLNHYGKMAGPGGGVLIGVDLKKEKQILELAYDDPQGITAAFNLNLLERINREANGGFELDKFKHQAIYNRELGRVEMHLVSLIPQLVKVNQTVFRFNEGETIHTESSYKYSLEEFCEMGNKAHLKIRKFWQDPQKLYCMYYFERE